VKEPVRSRTWLSYEDERNSPLEPRGPAKKGEVEKGDPPAPPFPMIPGPALYDDEEDSGGASRLVGESGVGVGWNC